MRLWPGMREDRDTLHLAFGDLYDIGRAGGRWYAFRRDGGGDPLKARRLGRLRARLRADRATGDRR